MNNAETTNKKFLRMETINLFDKEFNRKDSKLYFCNSNNENYFNGNLFYIENEKKYKIPFHIKFKNKENYTISIDIKSSSNLNNSENIVNFTKNNPLMKAFNSTYMIEYKECKLRCRPGDIYLLKEVNNGLSKIDYNSSLSFYNYRSKIHFELNIQVEFNSSTIKYKNDYINFFHMHKGSKPILETKALGLQYFELNEENINLLKSSLCHNFFYYMNYYNDKKPPFREITMQEMVLMNSEDLIYRFYADKSIEEILEI